MLGSLPFVHQPPPPWKRRHWAPSLPLTHLTLQRHSALDSTFSWLSSGSGRLRQRKTRRRKAIFASTFNLGRLLCDLLYAASSLYQCWDNVLQQSSPFYDFAFGCGVYPTWASAHPFVIVCGAIPFQQVSFPSREAAKAALLTFAPPSNFTGYGFGRLSWEIDLSLGPTECFHVGDLVHVQKAGVFAGGEAVRARGTPGSTMGFVRFTVRGVWADTTADECGQNFYIDVLSARASRSPRYSSPGRWLLDNEDHSAIDPNFNDGASGYNITAYQPNDQSGWANNCVVIAPHAPLLDY
jgi:hypothetical protein